MYACELIRSRGGQGFSPSGGRRSSIGARRLDHGVMRDCFEARPTRSRRLYLIAKVRWTLAAESEMMARKDFPAASVAEIECSR